MASPVVQTATYKYSVVHDHEREDKFDKYLKQQKRLAEKLVIIVADF